MHTDSDNQSASQSTNPGQNSATRKRKGEGDDKEPNHPKRGRPASYHPDKLNCDPCALWQQSGADQNLRKFHSQKNIRHAGHDASAIAAYAYHDKFHLILLMTAVYARSVSEISYGTKKMLYHTGLKKEIAITAE